MKSNYQFLAIIALFTIIVLSACAKSEGDGLRKLTYKIDGNVGVPINVQYTPSINNPNETDFTDYNYEEIINNLPWEKTVSLHKYVSGGGLSVSVEDGIPGTSLTLRIYEGDLEKAVKTVVVNHDGWIDEGLLNYYFPEFRID